MADIVSLALLFFGLIGLGFLGGKLWRTDETALRWLNVFVIYFSVPALLFQSVSRAPIEQLLNWRFVFATTLATYIAFAIAFTFATLRGRGDLTEATMQGLVGSYANIGYMGPPLAILAFGLDAVVPAALIFCFEVALCFTLAHLLLLAFGEERQRAAKTFAAVPLKIILHPFIIATILGFAGSAWQVTLPDVLDQLISFLQSAAIPSALFALGVTVALRPFKPASAVLAWSIAIKLILHPLIVYFILTLLGGFDPVWVFTAVLMASLPPATTIYILATQHKIDVLSASSAISIGTACSVLTVTAILYLVTSGLLPDDPYHAIGQVIRLR